MEAISRRQQLDEWKRARAEKKAREAEKRKSRMERTAALKERTAALKALTESAKKSKESARRARRERLARSAMKPKAAAKIGGGGEGRVTAAEKASGFDGRRSFSSGVKLHIPVREDELRAAAGPKRGPKDDGRGGARLSLNGAVEERAPGSDVGSGDGAGAECVPPASDAGSVEGAGVEGAASVRRGPVTPPAPAVKRALADVTNSVGKVRAFAPIRKKDAVVMAVGPLNDNQLLANAMTATKNGDLGVARRIFADEISDALHGCARYWVAYARVAEAEGDYDAVLALYEDADAHGAEPKDELRLGMTGFCQRAHSAKLQAATRGGAAGSSLMPVTPRAYTRLAQAITELDSTVTSVNESLAGFIDATALPPSPEVEPVASLAPSASSVLAAEPAAPVLSRSFYDSATKRRVRAGGLRTCEKSEDGGDADGAAASPGSPSDSPLTALIKRQRRRGTSATPSGKAPSASPDAGALTSVVIMTPVRASKKKAAQLGQQTLLTPVRRSTRKTKSAHKKPVESATLADTNYAYAPNPNLSVNDLAYDAAVTPMTKRHHAGAVSTARKSVSFARTLTEVKEYHVVSPRYVAGTPPRPMPALDDDAADAPAAPSPASPAPQPPRRTTRSSARKAAAAAADAPAPDAPAADTTTPATRSATRSSARRSSARRSAARSADPATRSATRSSGRRSATRSSGRRSTSRPREPSASPESAGSSDDITRHLFV